MLDNTISLSVDAANDGNPVAEVMTRFEESANRSVYIGALHSLVRRCLMAFTRNFPTVSGNFKGVAKSTLKFTQDFEVAGVDETTVNVAPIIGTISFSIPVGCTPADVMHVRQRMLAALDDDTLMARSTELLEV